MMQEWTKSAVPTRRVGILLFPRFSNLCLANCIEPMRAANDLAQTTLYQWQVLSPAGGPVNASSGLSLLGEDARTARGFDLLLVLASYDHIELENPATRALLRDMARKTPEIAGFDTAPWLMGAAGLLDGRRATIHWDLTDVFAQRFPRIEVERARVVRDGNRVTSAGALSALDHALDMIRNDAGAALTLDVEALFLREGGHPGPATGPRVGDALVRRALGIMRATLAEPLPLAALAARLSCQPRTLDRRFRGTLGAPPGTVYRHLRLTQARQLAESTQMPISEIAALCGYENAAAFGRAFRARYGCAPGAMAQLNKI